MNVAYKKSVFTGLFALAFALFSTAGFASAGGDDEEFNPGEMILHHISDAHEIHIIGDFAIYLPVILFTEDGVDIFSSSHFYHNVQHAQVNDSTTIEYMAYDDYIMYHETIYYKGDSNEIGGFNEEGHLTNAKPFDFSITKTVAGMLLVMALMLIIFTSVARRFKKNKGRAPKGIQSLMEPLILFVRDEVAIPNFSSKEKAYKFLPFLLSIFFFIWIANLLGLMPFLGGFNITGTIGVTAVMAALVFIITTVKGNRHYWTHILWPPGIPIPIRIMLALIEFAGIFIKPFVLMVRLTANITAGHIIILAFVSLVLIFGEQSKMAGYFVGAGSVLFMVFMFFIELLVAFLQAYVFTLLAAIYFADATQEAHH